VGFLSLPPDFQIVVRLRLPATRLVINDWRNELSVSPLQFKKAQAKAQFR
jgi:hypothetical protein